MQSTNQLPSFRHLEEISTADFIDQITGYLDGRHHSEQAKVAAERAILWFARKRWVDYCSQDMRAKLHEHATTQMLSVPLERISAVTACMNRNAHILETLPTWLASNRFEEIIIIDYGSSEPLEQTLSPAGFLEHANIRLIRVEAEKWCLAEAFNAGLLEAKAPFTLKLDADTLMRGLADMSLRLSAKQFRTGNWRTFDNNVLNGVVLAPTDAIKRTGGYNEQLRRYGWDDCDFYERLSELALIKTDLVEREFRSLDHSDDERVANSDALAKANDLNRLIQGNRVLTNLLPKWTDKGKRQFAFHSLAAGDQELLASIRDFAYKISKIQDDYIYSEDSVYEYSSMLRDIKSQISHGSDQQQAVQSIERAPIVLMTSLYEDRAETRRCEMIRCLRINSQIFDKIIVLYEQPTSKETELKISIADELKRLSDLSESERQLAELEIININERPAYSDFFELSLSWTEDNQKPWFVIANSDIAFDKSIERIYELDNPEEVLVCLSRWDKCLENSTEDSIDCHLDPEGGRWSLIESTINGSRIPNYLSADAWIYKKQPDDWKEYTYRLGTYFCDSFFANRAYLSGRPVINPCHSIRCFHYHDEGINSSAQKFEDKIKLEQLHSDEKERLGGSNPVAGVPWTTLEICGKHYPKQKPFRWKPEGGVWLRLGYAVNVSSILLMIEAALDSSEPTGKDVFLTIYCGNQHDKLIDIICKFASYLDNPRLFIDLKMRAFDPSLKAPKTKLYLDCYSAVSLSDWNLLALKITRYLEASPSARHSDHTHLELGKLLTSNKLHAHTFLSATYPELFNSISSEALLASQLSKISNLSFSQIQPRFSLITSLYKAYKYLPRLLENYEAIASLGPCELVIIDANSNNTDRDIVDSFISSSDYGRTIQYTKLPEDPGIYGCWMKGIDLANSPYVSNFNADDRRSAVHPHLLSDYLETHSEVDVCFTSLRPVKELNISWYEHYDKETWFDWYEQHRKFNLDDFKTIKEGIYCSQNIAHCMPMWRRCLHETLGPFREDKYGTSADWAFWLECMSSGKVLALANNAPYGLYFVSPTSHNRVNDVNGEKENLILSTYYKITQTGFLQQ